MLETKYSKFLTILLVIIIIAVIGLIGYLGYTYYTNYVIDKEANEFVSSYVEEVTPTNTATTNTSESTGSISENIDASESSYSSSVTTTYKGYNVIGTIEIPATDIKYPILEAPPTVNKLETSVVALYPQDAELNTVGNIVIVGHNYRNSLFFSNNKKLVEGDIIYITDLTGTKVKYTIYSVFTADENDTSFYNRDTDGAMEITLSTCTDDSSARIIVEARAES